MAMARFGVGFMMFGLVAACGGVNPSAPWPSGLTSGAQAVKRLQTELNELGSLLIDNAAVPTSAFASATGQISTMAVISNWSTTPVMPDPRSNGTCYPSPVTLKEWMSYELDEDATRCDGPAINVFGRVKSSLANACIVLSSLSATRSTDLPESGSTTVTLNAAKRAQLGVACGKTLPNSDFTIGVSYASPSSTLNFDRKITLALPAELSDGNQVFYVRFNSSVVSIASSENDSSGASRTIATFGYSTGVLKVDYVFRSASGASVVVHRVYKDETSNAVRFHSLITDANNSNQIRYVLSGKPNSEVDLALSVKVTGYGATGSSLTGDACVVPSTGNISSSPTDTNGAFTCGAVTGRIESDATGSALVKTSVDAAATTWWNISSTAPWLSWSTLQDMLTAGL